MNDTTKKIIAILSVLLLLSVCLNLYDNFGGRKDKTTVKTVEKRTVVTKTDTIIDTIPKIKTEKIIKYVTETLNTTKTKHDTICYVNTVYKKDNNGNLYAVHDTVYAVKDSIVNVPVDVEIPITQKEYSDDSTYTAWVSGYNPKLDSINIYRKNVTETIEKETTIEKTKNYKKRFGVGPVVFGGYDIQNKKLGWGVGIGVSYHIFRW